MCREEEKRREDEEKLRGGVASLTAFGSSVLQYTVLYYIIDIR